MVRLKQRDKDVTELFELGHASRILQAGDLWLLDDENYEVRNGKIQRRATNRNSKKPKKQDGSSK